MELNNMYFDIVLKELRLGRRIYRRSCPEKGSLCGTAEKVMGSFYLTIYDVLAEDWTFCNADQFPEEIERDIDE